MKGSRFLFLFIFLFAAQNTFARWNKGMLRIREERGRSISVTIDGMRYNKIGKTITVPNLSPGRHMIKVFAYNSNGYGYRNGLMLYQGTIDVHAGTIYYCSVIDRGMDVEENCCIDDYGHWNNNDNWDNWDEESQTWNNNRKWNHDDRWNNDTDRNNDNNNYEDNNWAHYNGGLSNSRYIQLIDQVRKASFESSKVTVLNTMLRNTTLTVAQMLGILRELTFESTKLQFAKDNYNKMTDKRNAFMINDLFTFQSSKDDFLEFLGRQR
jgi:hypothetical protein